MVSTGERRTSFTGGQGEVAFDDLVARVIRMHQKKNPVVLSFGEVDAALSLRASSMMRAPLVVVCYRLVQ